MTTQLLHTESFTATLVRSKKRRSLGIYVRDGKVTVRAPMNEAQQTIEHFVQQKQGWIQSHLLRQQQTITNVAHSFADGDTFLWLNTPLTLEVRRARPTQVYQHQQTLNVVCSANATSGRIKKLLEGWYKTQALTYLTERVAHFAQVLNLHPKAISVRRYKTRWGSCNHKGEIQFNWLIMMAPQEVVDYVVVHELCHLKHFNHSSAFWRLVASVTPDYSQHRDWLKHQSQLAWPDND